MRVTAEAWGHLVPPDADVGGGQDRDEDEAQAQPSDGTVAAAMTRNPTTATRRGPEPGDRPPDDQPGEQGACDVDLTTSPPTLRIAETIIYEREVGTHSQARPKSDRSKTGSWLCRRSSPKRCDVHCR
ncbi:hypothetical protein AGMMS50218_01100 [Actinomycetota bacterium]|nr:hypothetical protein AGMMS50218_01100 [Actinomycetota bacterium]